jgi:hypothetical protein
MSSTRHLRFAAFFAAFLVASVVACSDPGGGGPDGDPDTDPDARPPDGTCFDPATGEPVPAGTTYESYTLGFATSLAECDAAHLVSTCDAATQTFLPPPGSSASCVVEPLPPDGAGYFFSDCAAGAEAGCIAGDNTNPGTSPDEPKRDLTGMDVNALPAGTHLVFARGGAWDQFHVVLNNQLATPTEPIVFGSYAPPWGGIARPLFHGVGLGAFEFGTFNSPNVNDGGYTLRNLRLTGNGKDWGLWLRDQVRYVLVENVDIHGFGIGIHAQSSGENGVNHFTVRSSTIRENVQHGWLGDAFDVLLENNTFTGNNIPGGGFRHAIYMGGEGARAVIRNNVLVRNSAPGGVCDGGNLTMHGRWEDVLIEGNLIQQDSAVGGCYGFSINPGYDTPESFRNYVIRGNTVVNVGNCSVCITSAPGAIVENNLFIHTTPGYHAGVQLPSGDHGPGDAADGGAIIRNNTMYAVDLSAGAGVAVREGGGTDVTVVSNLIFGAPTCIEGTPGVGENNLCPATDPLAAPPSPANDYACTVADGGAAIDAGHPTLSSPTSRNNVARVVPDVGACER